MSDNRKEIQNEDLQKKELTEEAKNIKETLFKDNKWTNLSIYLGAGMYEIIVGLLLAWFVSFLIGLPIIMAYPYIHPVLLWILKIFGWFLVTLGLITILTPIIKSKVNPDSNISKYLLKLQDINKFILLILLPIGIFLALALNSEVQRSEGKYNEERSVVKLYFLLLFLAGFIHTLMGIVLIMVIPSLISGYYDLLFPYLNADLMNFLYILGWVCLIPGIILLISSGFSKKLSSIEDITREGKLVKIILIAIMGASVFITMVFPIGTFFGLTLIQEFYSISQKKSQ